MKRKRLSRRDSRDRTAQRLLDAAGQLIATRGLSGTTLEGIAESAGYSRGAFYSNFRGKSDLFINLLRRDLGLTNAQLRTLRNDSLPLEQIYQGIREIYGLVYRNDEAFMNWTEARMLAARDATFRAQLEALLLERWAEVTQVIDYVRGRTGLVPPLDSRAVAMGLNSLVEGLKLSMLSSPGEMRPEDAESVLASFVTVLLTMAPRGATSDETVNNDSLVSNDAVG